MKYRFKTLMLGLLACIMAGSLNAQEEKDYYVARDRAMHASDQEVVSGKNSMGWVRSHFFDEWFFQLQGGGQLYYGTDDREGPFSDRLTGNAEIQVGRRIFPMFGFRGGLGYGYAHGFLTKERYASGVDGGAGECGTDAFGNSLGGYYWDYSDNLLMQKWKYYYFGVDLFMDLAIFRGAANYNENKPWNHVVYGGVHTKYSLSETNDKSHRSEFHMGYICKYNFPNFVSIYADIRYSLIERLFDREWVRAYETPGFGVDNVLNFQIGVMYKFHIRTEDERSMFVRNVKTEAINEVETHSVHISKSDTIRSVFEYDSTLAYDQVNVDTPEMQALKDSLLNEIKKRQDRNKNNFEDDLTDILLNQLLPYEMVFFNLDKWDILPDQEMKIDKMARIMKAYPDHKFLLYGSADSKTGTVKRNEFLSHRRADVIYDQLVYKYGIPESQLERFYLGGILDYTPFELNRATVIIMDHPTVKKAFEEMKQQGKAGGKEVNINN